VPENIPTCDPSTSPGGPARPTARILTVNGGSSSIKFALFECVQPLRRRFRGSMERIGFADASLRVVGIDHPDERRPFPAKNIDEAVRRLLDRLSSLGELDGITAVGHRIVHGGPHHFDPQIVTPELLADLRETIPFAPAHLPAEIRLLEALAQRFPDVPQVVCFDTAFHKGLRRVAAQLPIPRHFHDEGIRRYGFHGLSFSYLMEELGRTAGPAVVRGKVILAHLGSGSSLAAVENGFCLDTTMGFTPTGGVMMATRSGDLDPGVLVHLARAEELTADKLDHLVNQESGLLGISGTSSDMRDLVARLESDPSANEAFESYCYSVQKGIAAMAAAMGGVGTLIFSGGIGEHAPEVRGRILSSLCFLGIQFDRDRNRANSSVISSAGSAVLIRVIPTDEEVMIAKAVSRLTAGESQPPKIDSVSPQFQNADGPSDELLRKMDAYWRAANFLSLGQIYLLDNPLLKEPLEHGHIKKRLLGHWGTTPGLNLIYVHLNRVIKQYDLNALYVAGPGHGGPGIVANVYLEGTYTEVYPAITRDEAGMRRLFKQFSFPGGIGSHCTPELPGSIHEGGELGYSLSHAYGAAFDNPDLLVACVVGDGEAETGPLATAWHSNKFLNPARDGAVLPILHLNGFKIANPTVLSRIPKEELRKLLEGYGYNPHFVEGDDPMTVHRELALTLDAVVSNIRQIQTDARSRGFQDRPTWPMIVLRTPKGWTCPKEIDGKREEGSWRSHQVPMGNMDSDEHLRILESWMKSYRPEELFDETGRFRPELAALAPEGEKRMGAIPHANGGALLRNLNLPDYRLYAVGVPAPGAVNGEATRVQGKYLRDVMTLNADARNFRVFSPDELASNRWQDVLESTGRRFVGEIDSADGTQESPDGRAMEMLSEHQCQGWLEGYLLTGRHGFFSCYEAFVHIVDSMVNQHAKWLKVCHEVPWRRPIASLNYLLSSHVWRQDHNGFSHQDPGFIDHVMNKKAEVVRVYLPPDANTLLSVTDHCLRSRNYVNVVVAGKQPAPQWLTMDEAVAHCAAGIGVWAWASNDAGAEPDVVLGCCGDVPTLEALAAVALLREYLPVLKVRLVNVVDLMKLQPATEHPHGLPDTEFDALFTRDKPVIFAFHGYPWLIHRLTYRRKNHQNLHVRGYIEEGTTTTPFDMCVRNRIDRFHLTLDVIARVPGLGDRAAGVAQAVRERLLEHERYIPRYGTDLPEISGWQWAVRDVAVGSAAVQTA
jgi:xylulose-5-phosphate/fructose-6-phosphate phosphoketolase